MTEIHNIASDDAQERFFQLLNESIRDNPDKLFSIEDYNRLKFRAGKETNNREVYEPINTVRIANGLEPWD